MFLEEPVWPPEDFATLAEVRAKGGLDIAAGENACTVHQFRQMLTAGAVSYAQPSVIKVGGITRVPEGRALGHGRSLYPGFLANVSPPFWRALAKSGGRFSRKAVKASLASGEAINLM